VIRSEIAAHLYFQHPRKHAIIADVGMAIERKVSSVQRDVSFDQSSNPSIGWTNKRPQTTPKHAVMDQETVGVLLDGLPDGGLAQIYRGGQPADVTGVADLQTVQRLGGVSDLLGDP